MTSEKYEELRWKIYGILKTHVPNYKLSPLFVEIAYVIEQEREEVRRKLLGREDEQTK